MNDYVSVTVIPRPETRIAILASNQPVVLIGGVMIHVDSETADLADRIAAAFTEAAANARAAKAAAREALA